jgi:DNA-binding LytR/AlgR family response regulator
MMNYLIISNNAEELNLLTRLLSQIPSTTVSSVSSANELESTSPLNVQVAICNIELMNDNLLQTLTSRLPEIIIVATCNIAQIAIQQPPKEIFGYLPSPITFERVLAITENIQTMLQHRTTAQVEKKKDYVFIKSEYKLIKTNFCDILFIAGMKDYTQVYIKGKQSPLTTLQNLKEFETKLPSDEFVRVHRSYIVSLNQVDVIARNEIMMGTHHIPIGDSYRQTLDLIIAKNS